LNVFGSLDISTSALVAQRLRMTAISANLAIAGQPVNPKEDPDRFRRKLVQFAPGSALGSRNGRSAQGVHVSEIVLDRSPFNKKYDPTNPLRDDDGYVSYPNIEPAREMVDAITAARSYEANITAAEATKSMLQTSLRLLA
jgi:flagellar basal-body rod protein FlgC